MDASWQGIHRRTVDKTKWLIMDPLEGILRLLRELASVAGKEVETVDATRSELCRDVSGNAPRHRTALPARIREYDAPRSRCNAG